MAKRKNFRSVAERQAAEAEQNAKWEAALKVGTQQAKEKKAALGPKKKDAYMLLDQLDVMPVIRKSFRSLAEYKCRSYNPIRQLHDLIKHLFVKYPVPVFMYECMLKQDTKSYLGINNPHDRTRFLYVHDIYREWFICIAQGGSFQKLVKGSMTKKEAVYFLNAPSDNTITNNVWWSKMKVLGIPQPMIDKLIDKIFGNFFFDDPDGRLAEVLNFFANWHEEIGKQEFTEITDFILHQLRNNRDFRFKGRTLTSMIKYASEWHILMQKARLGHNVEWQGLGLPPWEHITNDTIWVIDELCSNKDLMNEGRKQKHCVYGYVSYCVSGTTSIFSMRAYGKIHGGLDDMGDNVWLRGEERSESRITMEVRRGERAVVQIRGKLNRLASDNEKLIIRHWAGEKGFRVSSRY